MSGTDLLARTAELVAVPSVSRGEAALSALVFSKLGAHPWLEVERIGDNVVARTHLRRAQRLVVAGHLDTVPPVGNEAPRVDDATVWGIGACDMKGGVAVMLDLAASLREPAVDVTWCFYACEEVAREENGLVRLWADRPDLLESDAAVLCEPTDAKVEAGCQGSLRAVVHVGGVRAHSARPFTGVNAIHRVAPVLERLAAWKGRTVEIDGCLFTEQLQAVGISGGVAANVVPDHVAVTVNHRFAPDRNSVAARQVLPDLLDGILDESLGDRLEVVAEADGAVPALGHPLLASIVERSGHVPQGKVGWTDVATMWAHGVPATNFGPGDPLLAHHPDEHVTLDSLERARAVLADVLSGAPRAPRAGGAP